MNTMLRREQLKLTRQLVKFLLASGATYDAAWERYVVATPAGNLYVRPLGSWVACKFAEPRVAAELLHARLPGELWRLNHFSGKWNWHFARISAAHAMLDLEHVLSVLMAPQPQETNQ